MKKPKVIVLCGSSRFTDRMAVCAWLLEKNENAITMGLHLLPGWYDENLTDHLAEHEGVAEQMDELHKRKIDLADEIFVVDYNNYVGISTKSEIEYAKKRKLKIRYYTQDVIGKSVDRIIIEYLKREIKTAGK